MPAHAPTSSPEPSRESSASISAVDAWLAPYSSGTQRKYREAMRSFGRFLGVPADEVPGVLLESSRGPLRALLELWVQSDDGRSDSFRIMQLSAVQSWLRWAEESELGGPGKVRVRHGLSVEAPQVELVGEIRVRDAIRKLLERPSERGIRDALVLAMLAVLGLRRATLCRVQVSDFSKDFSRLRVRRKGGVQHLLEVPEDLQELLRSWIAVSGIDSGPILAALDSWGQVVSQGMSGSSVHRIVRSHVGCSPHALRRLGGAHAMASGADLEALRGFLGHRGLASTARYTRREGDSGGVVRRSLSRALLPRKPDADDDAQDS